MAETNSEMQIIDNSVGILTIEAQSNAVTPKPSILPERFNSITGPLSFKPIIDQEGSTVFRPSPST